MDQGEASPRKFSDEEEEQYEKDEEAQRKKEIALLAKEENKREHSKTSSTNSNNDDKKETEYEKTRKKVHHGVKLLMTNHFAEAQKLFAQEANKIPRLAFLNAMLAFLKAISTFGEGDLAEALAVVWSAEEFAKSRASSTTPAVALEGKLVQADTYLLGSLIQFLQQAYIRSCFNMRTSWKYYQSVEKELKSFKGEEREELVGWCQFGIGMFNLWVSLLPPSVLTIAEWIGFGGDRKFGIQQLNESANSSSFIAPFSCLLLLTYYVSISPFIGQQTPDHIEKSKDLIAWGAERYPGGVFFALMESRYHRSLKKLQKAIDVADDALEACSELPQLKVLFHYQKGWCAYFLLDWQNTADYFDSLLFARASARKKGEEKKEEKEDKKSKDKDDKKDDDEKIKPSKASTQAFYAYHIGLCYLMKKEWSTAHKYFTSIPQWIGSTAELRPIDQYAKRRGDEWSRRLKNHSSISSDEKTQNEIYSYAILDNMELILAWNGFVQMEKKELDMCTELIEEANRLASKIWDMEDTSRYHLLAASILRGLDNRSDALERYQKVLSQETQLEKSKKAKQDGILAFTFHELTALQVDNKKYADARAFLTKANKQTSYELYKPVQVRLHSLDLTLKKEKV